MADLVYKRVASSSLSQHVGKPVTLLGEFVKVEPSGRMFTMKISPNITLSVHLQEPMRAVKLHPDDCELFNHNLDGEKHVFFQSHLPAFKRMWNEEGKMYWLRFLITFKIHFEDNLCNRTGSDRLMNFIFIYIHKQFVEGSYGTAKKFIENIFIAAKHFHNLPEQSFTKNPFYTKESREAFRTLLGKPDLDDEIPVPVMGFVCSVYFEFTSSVCALLKKWLQEPDLTAEIKEKVDYTLFYWRPSSEWEDKKFTVGCFEKYLANYWKEALPKMLLTCDIHNIFNNHTTENCCNYEKDMNVFDLLKDQPGPPSRFCMPHVKLLKPTVVSCGTHNNCHLKILHDDKCPEPYLCEGKKPCFVTCEVTCKKHHRSKLNQANPWKKLISETFASKDPNRRTVSTFAQSHDTRIETYLHDKESEKCEVKECAETIADEFLCLQDADMRNSFNQHKRKEQLKNRLRSKLNKKYYFEPKDYEDREFCWAMYEQAQQAWICDMCEGNFKDFVNAKANYQDTTTETNSFSCGRALTSVAVGTEDLVIGRVVNASVLLTSQSNANCSESHEKKDSKTKSKKSKSKKKKGNKKSHSDSTCKNLESVSGDSVSLGVSESSNSKTQSENESTLVTDDSKCRDEFPSLNGDSSNSSEIKIDITSFKNELNTTKPGTSAKTENDLVMKIVIKKNDSDKNSFTCNGDSVNTFTCTTESGNVICANESDKSVIVDKVIERFTKTVKNLLKKDTKDAPQCVNEVNKVESSVDQSLNGVEIVNNNAGSPLVNEKSTVEKFLESVGLTDEYSPQKVVNSGALINNEALHNTDNEIPEVSNNVDSPVDTAVDEFLTLIGVIKNPAESNANNQEPIHNQAMDVENSERKVKLKTCAFCGKKEIEIKSFKRCARCKIEKFVQQRYYCSRSCQLEDWEESHRDEHSRKPEPML